MVERLHNGEVFPAIELPQVGGGVLDLPADLAGRWGVVLVYRGSWCPFCNEQLAAFVAAAADLANAELEVVAFSVDDEGATAAFAAKHGIRFVLGHSADVGKIVEAVGAYETTHPERGRFLENTGFVLAPDGSVVNALYSSRAIGRLMPGDVIRLVSFLRQSQK